MGRTGRKREGHVLILLTKGKEEENYKRAWDDYRFIQNEIESGNKFIYHHDQSPRILPRDITPIVDKKCIEIPFENTQPDPKKRTRAKSGKKAKIVKPFFMPEGVKTGFMKASKIGKVDDSTDDSDEGEEDLYIEELAPVLQNPEAGLLTASQEKELNRRFKTVYGTEEEKQLIAMPTLETFPAFQRNLTKTKYVNHGRASKNMVRMFRKMNRMDQETINRFREKYDPELLKPPLAPIIQKFQPKTKAFKPVVPLGKGLSERSGNVPKPKPKTAPKRPVPAVKRKRNSSTSPVAELDAIDLISSSSDANDGNKDEEDRDEEDRNEDEAMDSTSSLPTPPRRRTFATGSSSDEELPDIADMIKGFQNKSRPKSAIPPMTSKAAKAAAGKKRAMAVERVAKKAPARGKKTRKLE